MTPNWKLEIGQILGTLFMEGKITLADAWNLAASCEWPIDEKRMEAETEARAYARNIPVSQIKLEFDEKEYEKLASALNKLMPKGAQK